MQSKTLIILALGSLMTSSLALGQTTINELSIRTVHQFQCPITSIGNDQNWQFFSETGKKWGIKWQNLFIEPIDNGAILHCHGEKVRATLRLPANYSCSTHNISKSFTCISTSYAR